MRTYQTNDLLILPHTSPDPDLIVEVTPANAGWEFIHFQARQLAAGQTYTQTTGENELAIVILSGTVNLTSDRGEWKNVGKRQTVYEGLPYALYLPRHSQVVIEAVSAAQIALTWVPTDQDHPAQLITPAQVTTELRGGDNACRQINRIIAPGFDCHRLVVVEVYTPSGGWSSYPPHKHDVHRTDPNGTLLEADLEEIYYHKLNRPEGFVCQRVYTGTTSPLQQAGHPIDALLLARNDSVVLVPEGYHPVVCPPGYTGYYLNVLAGSAQVLTASDDPEFSWVKSTYRTQNPDIPLYDLSQAGKIVHGV